MGGGYGKTRYLPWLFSHILQGVVLQAVLVYQAPV